MRSRLAALVVLALALGAAGCRSMSIRGVVRDAATGSPIPGAFVRVEGAEAETGALGTYALKVRHRRYQTIVVNAPGYFMRSASVSSRADDPESRHQTLDFDLVRAHGGEAAAPTAQPVPADPDNRR